MDHLLDRVRTEVSDKVSVRHGPPAALRSDDTEVNSVDHAKACRIEGFDSVDTKGDGYVGCASPLKRSPSRRTVMLI